MHRVTVMLSFVFFFFIVLRPPRSTLFPYTTLFRSMRRTMSLWRLRRFVLCFLLLAAGRAAGQEPGQPSRQAAERRKQDRKSTRLNSSHSQISYAVFCLKKKKKKIQSTKTNIQHSEQ